MIDDGQEKAPASTHPHAGKQGEGKSEGLIFDNLNDKSPTIELQSENPLETVIRLLDCVLGDYSDHKQKNAKIALIADYCASFLDNRSYTSGEDLDDIPY